LSEKQVPRSAAAAASVEMTNKRGMRFGTTKVVPWYKAERVRTVEAVGMMVGRNDLEEIGVLDSGASDK
jgi:hypothetical protein